LALRRTAQHGTLRAVSTSIWFWIAFHIGVFVAIGIDLFTFKRRERELSMRAAARRTVLWVLVSLGFNLLVWRIKGAEHALDFLTAYLIEYSLSADNIFVFVLIFTYFQVPRQAQHRALVWGVMGALIMRGAMILGGIILVRSFHFILYLFGLLLILNALRMLLGDASARDFGQSWLVRVPMRLFRITPEFHGEHFKVRVGGRWMLTRLALAMLVIEMADLLFAIDSIPAVFAITRDPFIAYTSNICAILGLRSLYFLLAHLMDRFIYLRTGLGIILGFIGLKMILSDVYPVPTGISLGVIVLVLAMTIGLSILVTRRRKSIAES
jgi:tellurite resistance protein TerC